MIGTLDFFDDDGTEINPDLIKKPFLVVLTSRRIQSFGGADIHAS